MWIAPIAKLLALAATVPQPAYDSPAGVAPQPIATRQTLFAVPFRIERAQRPSQEPVEVQLFVSGDRGRTWQLYDKVEPGRGYFLFRAGADGEFWFTVRTLDRSGRLQPQSADPGLRVIVDTLLPKLELQASQGQAGQITARWKIDEPNVKPETLTIQYRTPGGSSWQPVAVDPRQMQSSGTTRTGEVTWWSKAGSGEIQIRAEVSDTAGNRAVSHSQVQVERVAAADPPAAAGSTGRWRAGTAPPPATDWPANRSTDTPMAQNLPPGTVAGRVNPPIGNRYVAPSEQPASVAREGLPPGERPRMVNAQLFELEYDLGAARPSDISQVELWGTRDGGRTWHSHALDNDNRSPILVTVDREGVYGFKVVARGNAGSPNSPPRPGELPDIFIGVDLTKPSARISGVTQDPSSGTLVISWQAGDKMLAARPVSLSFGTSPAGPWTPIASGLANTGRYSWPVDRRIPDEIYLRLEVRDEAGNVGVFETGNPVIIDRPAAAAPARTRDVMPSAHIRDVRPLGRSARKTPKRYYFR